MKSPCLVLILLCTASLSAIAQQPSSANAQAPNPTAINTKLHEDTVKLVALMGSRKRIVDTLEKTLQDGKEKMLQTTPSVTPAFADEWAKRMQEKTDPDAYVNVIISVYEKHFSDAEIQELVQAQSDANGGKAFTLSPNRKEKLSREKNTILSEVLGGCGQVGAKLGADVAEEIGKEHPEW